MFLISSENNQLKEEISNYQLWKIKNKWHFINPIGLKNDESFYTIEFNTLNKNKTNFNTIFTKIA